MSKAHKGKKHSEEARCNMSKARETPGRITARELFYLLPSNMPLQEKRKRLRQRFLMHPPQLFIIGVKNLSQKRILQKISAKVSDLDFEV